MASPAMINVGPQFNMDSFLQQLASLYQSRGFMVTTTPFGSNASIKFDKNVGGINMLLGLGQGATANCTLNNNVLTINYTNEDWSGKIIGLAVGWLLCFIPFVTSVVGIVRQLQLTKEISADAAMIAANSGSVANMGMGNVAAPAPVAPAQPPMQPAAKPASQPAAPADGAQVIVEEAVWTCQCGANGNTGAFCGQCGSSRP